MPDKVTFEDPSGEGQPITLATFKVGTGIADHKTRKKKIPSPDPYYLDMGMLYRFAQVEKVRRDNPSDKVVLHLAVRGRGSGRALWHNRPGDRYRRRHRPGNLWKEQGRGQTRGTNRSDGRRRAHVAQARPGDVRPRHVVDESRPPSRKSSMDTIYQGAQQCLTR